MVKLSYQEKVTCLSECATWKNMTIYTFGVLGKWFISTKSFKTSKLS